MFIKMQKIILLATLSFALPFFGQTKPQDSLKTEDILVVKPYTPEAKNVTKIKTNAELDESNGDLKRKSTYDITDFPVASTYKPNKGKAAGIAKKKKSQVFRNYLKAGFGNYTTPLFEAFVEAGDEKKQRYGLSAKHHSSQGGIDKLLLEDAFSDTDVSVFYKQNQRYSNWEAKAGVAINSINYYGIDQELPFTQNLIDNTDEQQSYQKLYAQGVFLNDDSFFEGGKMDVYNFSDKFSSNEFRFTAKPNFRLPIANDRITALASIDYLTGGFKQTYNSSNKLNYQFANIGISPSYELIGKNSKLNIGGRFYIANDLENSESNLLAYPDVIFSTKIINELSLSLGVTGDLIQHSYQEFSAQNPFISPTQSIQATDNKYKAFVEAKGNATANISYGLGASFSTEENKALFKQNQIQTNGTTLVDSYQLGNSFSAVYDNVTVFGINGNVAADFNNLKLQAGFDFNDYSMQDEAEAWNLPTLTGRIQANYIYNKWTLGAKLFLVSATKDSVLEFAQSIPTTVENDSYADLNLSGAYRFSDRLSAFLNLQNVFNQNYPRFYNYQVQPFQVLAGMMYKFDL